MTFEDWWYHGCRYGEHEPHKFASDMPLDAWLAKEAWQAATENAEALKPSHNTGSPKLVCLECGGEAYHVLYNHKETCRCYQYV